MRDRYEIKTEIDAVQEDLENNLAQLKDVITEKVDIKGKVHDKVEEKKAQAMDYVVRGRQLALDYYGQAQRLVREKPLVAAGIAGGILLVGAAILAVRSQLPEEPKPVTSADLKAALAELRRERRSM